MDTTTRMVTTEIHLKLIQGKPGAIVDTHVRIIALCKHEMNKFNYTNY